MKALLLSLAGVCCAASADSCREASSSDASEVRAETPSDVHSVHQHVRELLRLHFAVLPDARDPAPEPMRELATQRFSTSHGNTASVYELPY